MQSPLKPHSENRKSDAETLVSRKICLFHQEVRACSIYAETQFSLTSKLKRNPEVATQPLFFGKKERHQYFGSVLKQ